MMVGPHQGYPGNWPPMAIHAKDAPSHRGSLSRDRLMVQQAPAGGNSGERKESLEIIRVGMAEGHVSADPSFVLATLGLGSCVAVMLYDPTRRVAGVAHVMLPTSPDGVGGATPFKFADTAIPHLVKEMEKAGANPSHLVGKLAGGASMFQTAPDSPLNIGRRNVEAVREHLARLKIRVIAAKTGGNVGRSVYFFTQTGVARVRTVGGEEQDF